MQYPTSIFIEGLLNAPCITPAGKPDFGNGFTQRNGAGGFFDAFFSSFAFCAKADDEATMTTSVKQSVRIMVSVSFEFLWVVTVEFGVDRALGSPSGRNQNRTFSGRSV